MKLIDLIVKHVPRDKIPARAKFFAQDPNEYHETWGFSEEPCLHNEEGEWRSEEGFDNELYSVPVAEDARTTVITRGELEYLWDLQDQGYTLAFGAEPMSSGIWFVENYYTLSDGMVHHADKKSEGVITAYRPVKNESRPRVEYHELDHADTIVAAAIEERLSLDGDIKWPVDSDKICVNLKTGYLSANGDDLVIITRKQWDDYISRKIRVGDKVTVSMGDTIHEVLFIGKDTAFLRAESGFEAAAALNILTRVSE